MKIHRFENLFKGSEMLEMVVRLKVQYCREKLYDSFDTSETFFVYRLICRLGTYLFLKNYRRVDYFIIITAFPVSLILFADFFKMSSSQLEFKKPPTYS